MSRELKNGLPPLCYTRVFGNEPGRRMGIIKRGESGYYHCDYDRPEYSDQTITGYVKEMNDRLGVTEAQAEAMSVGSMFGWDCPGARPEKWEK